MAGPGSERLVQAALRCYPERWRSRHGEEAAELARLLMRDGTAAHSIAWSYVKGAASTRLALRSRRRLRAVVGGLVAAACSVGLSLALLSSSAPASAVTGPCSGGARGAGMGARGHVPYGHHDLTGGAGRSSASVRVTTRKPANSDALSGHDQHC